MNWFARSKQYREGPRSPVELSLEQLVAYEPLANHLNLNAIKPRALSAGLHQSRQKGRGIMFDEVRQYQSGDDIRNIDWRVTARTQKVHTKLFKEEHERPIWLLIDLSNNMYFGSVHTFKAALACRIAALLSWLALKHHDKIGFVVKTAQDVHSFKAVHNKRGLLFLFNQLIELHNQGLIKSGEPVTNPISLQDALTRLDKIAFSGSLMVLISDFYELAQKPAGLLHKMARQHQLSLAHISDPLEQASPQLGWLTLSNGQAMQSINTNDRKVQSLWQQQWQQHQDYLTQLSQQYACHCTRLSTSQLRDEISFLQALQPLFRRINK